MSAKEHGERANRGWHEKQTTIRKRIIPDLPRAVFFPYRIDLLFIVTVNNAQIEITARIIDCPIRRIRVEDAVNDEVCECKE